MADALVAYSPCFDCKDKPCSLCELNMYRQGILRQEKWISVDERLPDEEGDYLVWNKEQGKIEKRFFYRLPTNYPVESHPEIREYFGNFLDYKRITHWMPLPEPPKKKGGE